MVGLKKGDEISGPVHPALIGPHLKDISEPVSLKCPACQEDPSSTAKAKKATYASLEELQAHYGEEHPALEAPTEEPEEAEEVKEDG